MVDEATEGALQGQGFGGEGAGGGDGADVFVLRRLKAGVGQRLLIANALQLPQAQESRRVFPIEVDQDRVPLNLQTLDH